MLYKLNTKIVTLYLMIFANFGTLKSQNLTLRDRIPIYLQELCPGSGVCLNDAIDPDETGHSCCGACSCAEDCAMTGNCCFYDQNSESGEFAKQTTDIYSECLYPFTKPQEVAFPSDVFYSFKMVTASPVDSESGRKGTNASVTCGDVRVASWGSMLPVYSKQTGKIYKNRVCAEAFNVTDGEEWRAHLSCTNPRNRYDFASFVSGLNNGFISDLCFVKFVFKDFKSISKSVCYQVANLLTDAKCIPEFRLPINSSIPKEDIISGCASGLISPYAFVFTNVFCYICSGMRHFTPSLYRCYYGDGLRNPSLSSFTSILDSNLFSKNDSNESFVKKEHVRIACLNEEDIVVGNRTGADCRVILCPSGQIFGHEGECIYPSSQWAIDAIHIHIILSAEEIIPLRPLYNSLQNLQSPWPKVWRIKQVSYEVTNLEMQTRYIFVLQEMKFDSPFNPKTFFARLRKFIGKAWFLVSNNGTVKLQSTFAKFKSPQLASSVHKEIFRNNILSRQKKVVTKLYFCDHVTLLPTEYSFKSPFKTVFNKITNETLFDGEYMFISNENGDDVVVCLEDSGLFEDIPSYTNQILSHHASVQFLLVLFINICF